jgi:hypothetical protein
MLESCGVNGVATLDCIFPLISNLIYWLLLFSGTVSITIIIISGIRFITSGGEAKSVDTAKKSMTYAILGLLLVFLSFLIINVVAFVTNVACIKNFGDVFSATPFQSCGASSAPSGPTDNGPTFTGCLNTNDTCADAPQHCYPKPIESGRTCSMGSAGTGVCCNSNP